MPNNLTREQKIKHILINIPNMSVFSFKMYFGTPDEASRQDLNGLIKFAKAELEKDLLDLDVLYDDIKGNDELLNSLEEAELIEDKI